jgi:DNA-binding SARP family transcriptional activator/Tfp pilus assembly protein PilF
MAVRCGGTALAVPRGRQRAVLAALLLRANHVVPLDELAEALWRTDLPPSARVSVQNYVMRLRSTLGPAGARIGTRAHGYLIGVDDDELDITRFEALLRQARAAARDGRWPEAADHAASALALWRGEPLADAGSDVLAEREAPRLNEMRMQAAEMRIDADLHLGRHGEVIAELRQLARAEPLRERLHALLMLALYRDRRQAEALAAYQQARRVLVEELGTDPGPDLQQLHQQILDADPALLLPGPAARAASTAAPPRPAPPRQLPAAVADFTGRTAELAALTHVLADTKARGPGTVVISAVGGTAGVGKTALALHWAHQAAHQFPDGQMYVNLRGFDPSGSPATPETVIRGFLDALGVPPERIPPDPDAQAGLYRSLLADKQMLIVLDNTRDEQQVRPLLPASPESLVLVTSRHQLSGLAAAEGARLISLDMLSHAEATQLLTARLGHNRAAAEPEALSRIASLCACLPLALAVAAARAADSPGFPLAALAGELADSASRLDALDAGDPAASVQVVFSWSYQQLSEQAARLFRLLGLHPGPDISLPAAASLAATTPAQTRHLMRELARAHLIAEHVPGRYTFHDLLRAYAATQAQSTDSNADREAAIGRVLDHYLHTATSAAFRLNPAKRPLALAAPRPGTAPEQPADYRQALAWCDEEHQVLLAAIALAAESGFDTQAWQIPWAMAWFLWTRGHWQESVATQRTALAAATRLGDEEAQALSASILGTACTRSGDLEEARGHFATSLRLYEGLGNRVGVAKVHQNVSVLANRQGRYAEALGHAEQAVLLYHSIGDRTGEAEALNCVGWEHCVLGDYEKAREFCRQALTLAAEVGHRRIEPHAWDSLGYAEHHLGNFAEATACYQRALSRFRETGDRFTEADVLTRLGDTHQAAGKLTQAREAWQQALAILEDMQHPDAGKVRTKLAGAIGHASRNS